MHRDVVTHAVATGRFAVTASRDGQLKVWARAPSPEELTFAKAFRAHTAPPLALAAAPRAALAVSVASDRSLKLFDVAACDLRAFAELTFTPGPALVFARSGPARAVVVLVADAADARVHVFDTDDLSKTIRTLRPPHVAPVVLMAWNQRFECVVSVDARGIVEYWRVDDVMEDRGTGKGRAGLGPVPGVRFTSKVQTDLFEFAKKKVVPTSLSVSADGALFACTAPDRFVRVFRFATGKLERCYDARLPAVTGSSAAQLIPEQELGRRLERERQVEGDGGAALAMSNAVFDASGSFVVYATVIGIQVVELSTNRVARVLGLRESAERFLTVQLFEASDAGLEADAEAGERAEPLAIASSFDSQRVYVFGSREGDGDASVGRDVLNERPLVRSGGAGGGTRGKKAEATRRGALAKRATLHTSVGDIVVSLHGLRTPKTVENFCTHARNGYYNGVVFHRVIKGFMIQTGDPEGDGTGGESIWGGEFEDEIDEEASHEAGTLSMANAGPNTNGSVSWTGLQRTRYGFARGSRVDVTVI